MQLCCTGFGKLSKGLKNDTAACVTLQAENELRQKAEQAQTEALQAAGGQEARIQALQQELRQAVDKVNDVPAWETQLAAVRSQLEKALQHLQVSQALLGASCCSIHPCHPLLWLSSSLPRPLPLLHPLLTSSSLGRPPPCHAVTQQCVLLCWETY